MKRAKFEVNQRVVITSICEAGVILSYYADDIGNVIYKVRRETDNGIQLCRVYEIKAI